MSIITLRRDAISDDIEPKQKTLLDGETHAGLTSKETNCATE